MKKVFVLLMGVLGLCAMQVVHAEELRAGKSYSSGTVVELPQFGAHFTIPIGWRGESSGDQFITLYPPISSFVYLMRFMPNQDVHEFDRNMQQHSVIIQQADLFIKANAYAETPSSLGVGYSLQGNIGGQPLSGTYVMRPLQPLGMSYTKLVFGTTYAWNTPRDQQSMAMLQKVEEIEMSLIEQAKSRQSYSHNHSGAYAGGVPVAGKPSKDTFFPPAWLRYSQGDPFRAFGNTKIPKFKRQQKPGLYLYQDEDFRKEATHYSTDLTKSYWMNRAGTKRVFFCAAPSKVSWQLFRGRFEIQQRSQKAGAWKHADSGRYQIFRHTKKDYDGGDTVIESLFLNRKKGDSTTVMVEETSSLDDTLNNWYWGKTWNFNGQPYKQSGINQSCGRKITKKFLDLSACFEHEGRTCLYKIMPEDYEPSGHARSDDSDNNNSSGSSYDTHFGTYNGRMYFSAPGVDGSAGY